jgi:hypothetical protein
MNWIEQVKILNLDGAFYLILDILEPLGPLGAQALYVLQPAAGIVGLREMIGDIAQALEEPEGIERLRQQLETL